MSTTSSTSAPSGTNPNAPSGSSPNTSTRSPVPAPISGTAAGVPFLAIPAADPHRPNPPVVIAWHMMDPPRTESAFAAALPLHGLNAWRIYLGLPMCGARLPPGGFQEIMRLAVEDVVLKVDNPIAQQGAAEFPAALAELRTQLGLESAPLGSLALVGGSMGSAIAQLVMAETAPSAGIRVDAAVLISPVTQLRPMVDAIARRYQVTYPWSADSLRIAERLDFVARADDFVRAGEPAIRLIVGAEDDRKGFLEPAERLRSALSDRYENRSRLDLQVVAGMGHALAEEPGVAPAPQTAHAAEVDRHATAWLRAHLPGAGAE